MEWQAIVLVMQILMLAVGWFLFQQARGELSARAAETPVLGEVKALHRSIKQLLMDLEQTSDHASGQLESRCMEARQLIAALEANLAKADRLQEYGAATSPLPPPAFLGSARVEKAALYATHRPPTRAVAAASVPAASAPTLPPPATQEGRDQRRTHMFALADAGLVPAHIARETGFSQGEIETLLGLRSQRK